MALLARKQVVTEVLSMGIVLPSLIHIMILPLVGHSVRVGSKLNRTCCCDHADLTMIPLATSIGLGSLRPPKEAATPQP